MKWLVDYSAIGDTLIKNIGVVHQNFLPVGLLGASTENPYKLDVEKAKALLAKAGHPNGFKVTIDMRTVQPVQGITEALQQTAKRAGIDIEIIPGDGKQTLTKYRARQHDIYIGQWGADYWDPHTNADTFARNPDNGDDAKSKPLAWRNAWAIPELTEEDRRRGARARRREAQGDVRGDPGRVPQDEPVRDALPADRSGGVPERRPGVEARPDVRHHVHVQGLQDLGAFCNSPRKSRRTGARGARLRRGVELAGRFVVVILLTYLGLLAVTFFIGRVIPIDPVLAIVGDRAPEHVIARVREELGLNKPLWEQFYIYVSKVLHGDFGRSVLTSNPVMQDIRRAFPATLELATLGTLIGAGLGVPLGVWAAVRRGGLPDQIVRVVGLVGYSAPIFWLGLMALVVVLRASGLVAGPAGSTSSTNTR